MLCVVSPVDQTLSVAEEEVNVKEPPSQKVVAPLAVIVGTAGTGLTVTGIVFETVEEQPLLVTTTS